MKLTLKLFKWFSSNSMRTGENSVCDFECISENQCDCPCIIISWYALSCMNHGKWLLCLLTILNLCVWMNMHIWTMSIINVSHCCCICPHICSLFDAFKCFCMVETIESIPHKWPLRMPYPFEIQTQILHIKSMEIWIILLFKICNYVGFKMMRTLTRWHVLYK